MLADQKISSIEYDQALADLETVQFKRQAIDMQAPHFVFYVKDQLIKMFNDEDLVTKGGLTVTTSLDLELHNQAQAIEKEKFWRDQEVQDRLEQALESRGLINKFERAYVPK
jgi:peptidoglycan glycosyltransferase